MTDPTVAGVAVPVWLAAAYGVVLLLVAFALDGVARRTSMRSSGWRSGAFTYHADHDAWQCPRDQWLWPTSFDPDNRVMRYRGSPTVCNACPVKESCTTSPHGREITRNVDPWPSSEAERFHRAVACTVVVLGLLWPALSMLGHRTATERLVLGAAVAAVALGSWPLWSHLRHTPAGFPEHVPVVTDGPLDLPTPTLRGPAVDLPRTRYASDQREPEAAVPDERRPAGWSRLGTRP